MAFRATDGHGERRSVAHGAVAMSAVVRARTGRAIAPDLVEELRDGPLCVTCIAARRQLTLYAVGLAVASLRHGLLLDSVQPCRECGASRSTISVIDVRRVA